MCIKCQSSRGKTFQLKLTDYEVVLSQLCKEKLSGIILKPEKKEAIRSLWNGKDVFAVLLTGFGKSLIGTARKSIPILRPISLSCVRAELADLWSLNGNTILRRASFTLRARVEIGSPETFLVQNYWWSIAAVGLGTEVGRTSVWDDHIPGGTVAR